MLALSLEIPTRHRTDLHAIVRSEKENSKLKKRKEKRKKEERRSIQRQHAGNRTRSVWPCHLGQEINSVAFRVKWRVMCMCCWAAENYTKSHIVSFFVLSSWRCAAACHRFWKAVPSFSFSLSLSLSLFFFSEFLRLPCITV